MIFINNQMSKLSTNFRLKTFAIKTLINTIATARECSASNENTTKHDISARITGKKR